MGLSLISWSPICVENGRTFVGTFLLLCHYSQFISLHFISIFILLALTLLLFSPPSLFPLFPHFSLFLFRSSNVRRFGAAVFVKMGAKDNASKWKWILEMGGERMFYCGWIGRRGRELPKKSRNQFDQKSRNQLALISPETNPRLSLWAEPNPK